MDNLRILFVDENPQQIKDLVLTLNALGNPWEIQIIDSPTTALKAMRGRSFDVVITDIGMREMNGAEFMRHVHRSYPGTVRLILSDVEDKDAVLASVGYAHQCLSKPCTPGALWTAMTRSLRLRKTLDSNLMHRQISQIRSLPTLPQTYYDLIDILQSKDPSIKDIADVIQTDVGMTAKLLQILNSAFYGLTTRINTPLQAVSLLGLDKINALITTSGIFLQFDVPSIKELNVEGICNHSIQTGHYARLIARMLELEPTVCEDALLAGMLHDVGKLVELAYFRPGLKEAINSARMDMKPLYLTEREQMGVNHSQVGAYLLALWGLPDPIVEAAAYHHEPTRAGEPEVGVLACVHIANAMLRDSNASTLVCEGVGLERNYLEELNLIDRIDQFKELCAPLITER
ncbi:MAG: HDOD domain-containing protein [bacterium]|nr:HDOD domain-containing protein [bacterium]